MNKYEEIINLPHHVSKKHKKMSLYDRASQFMPFAALTGYDEEIFEKGREVDSKLVLSEDEKTFINEKISLINDLITNKTFPRIEITYFIKDNKKLGGKYITEIITTKKVDNIEKLIITFDKKKINFDNIVGINILNN